MRFTKMHGAGNDYIFVDCMAEPLPVNPGELARDISNRHFGVGGDGLILILPSDDADARMQMFNSDGTEAEMCGNGIRCVAKYVYEHDIAKKETLKIDTGTGILTLELEVAQGLVEQVRVDMGEPIFVPGEIPTSLPGNAEKSGAVVDVDLVIGGQSLSVTCLSMGNPHCVTFVEELTDRWVLEIGPKIETDSHFPNRVNAEFVEIISQNEVRQRTWERGAGETMACGTGAAAVCVAGVLTGRTGRSILVHLPGGDLKLQWNQADNHVYMTGPAKEVFSGHW